MAEMSQNVCISVKKEEREYNFCMPLGAPCGEAYDACFEALQELVKIAGKIAESAQKQSAEEDKEKLDKEPKE